MLSRHLRHENIIESFLILFHSNCVFRADNYVRRERWSDSDQPSTSGRNDESRRYIVGPSFEAKLPGNFAVEVDALYSRIGNSFPFSRPLGTNLIVNSGSATLDGGIVTTAIRNRGNSWEFPVLGKYYFGRRTSNWRPFVSTGYSFRKIWITSNATYAYSNIDQYPNVTPITASKNSSVSDTGVGAVFGGGLSYRAGRVSIAPESGISDGECRAFRQGAIRHKLCLVSGSNRIFHLSALQHSALLNKARRTREYAP